MKRERRLFRQLVPPLLLLLSLVAGLPAGDATAAPLPGGTLDPLSIPKYVAPLVIPPVMPTTGAPDNYAIAVRQFQQQILPATDNAGNPTGLPPTTVWSYGNAADNVPAVAPSPTSSFNYPALTIETTSNTPVNVRWINGLVDSNNNFLPHLLPVDQTVMWANPAATGCRMGDPNRTDCATDNAAPYTGPVPIITHVHGAHVDPHSDGYPFAWYLPAANNIPAGYSMKGSFFDDATGTNPGNLGYADFSYRNDQPAATIWYHDHAMGMTRNNVYAGPAGFWIIRGGAFDGGIDNVAQTPAVLPGPAPVAGNTLVELNSNHPVRNAIREIPIAIQDRSFNADGSLFYPDSRSFFDGFNGPYSGSAPTSTDIAPISNVEAFFNTMVVNGGTWPKLEVAPALYRLRLLNGCNSRMLNLSLVNLADNTELPFYQIGAEQGFLRQVVMVTTGFATPLPGDGTIPPPVPNGVAPEQALLMGNAERADVIVDFRGLPDNTVILMRNTGADEPFGGFPAGVVSDPDTTGQVMIFVVNSALSLPSDANTTPPENLVLNAKPALAGPVSAVRTLSLNEEESRMVCVTVDVQGAITGVSEVFRTPLPMDRMLAACAATGGVPMAPKAPVLGRVNLADPAAPMGVPLGFEDETGNSMPVQVTMADGVTLKTVNVSENPFIVNGNAPVEEWDIYNFTMDAHPIHLHLVEFEVISRSAMPGVVGPIPSGGVVLPTENGFKDTVIAYPGEITKVRAKFDIPGLYVWHCHIVEHEDNEMMRPFVVSTAATAPVSDVTLTAAPLAVAVKGATVAFTATAAGGSGNYEYKFVGRRAGAMSWGVAKNFSPSNTWNWDTTNAAIGTYEIQAWARNAGSGAAFQAISPVMTFEIEGGNSPTSVALDSAPLGTATRGTTVTFTAIPTGGAGAIQYQFWGRKAGAQSFNLARDWSTSATWNWNTTSASVGAYEVKVYAREPGSTRVFDVTSPATAYTVTAAVATAVDVVADGNAVTAGTPVTFTAQNVVGGTGPYQYLFEGRRVGAPTWGVARNWSTSANWIWSTTGLNGNFEVRVKVRHTGGAAAEATSAPVSVSVTP